MSARIQISFWLAVLTGLLFSLSAAAARKDAPEVYLQREQGLLRFGNDRVELTLHASSGYFRQILNKKTGIQHKKPNEGVWPFGLWVGTREEPQLMKAEIKADGIQEMTYRLEEGRDGAKRLMLTYPMLVDNGSRKPTGVGLGVSIDLAPRQHYFIIRAEIANGGGYWVTNFYAAQGEVLTGDQSRATERVTVPTRGSSSFQDFSYASLGAPTYTWGWADYSGQRGGIGIAYVNKQGIQWMFDWKKTADGLLQGWHLFDTRGYWHFESSMNDYQKSLLIQPLEPGNNFTTDEWLIVPHAGDWHRTADAYRERYVEVFKNDYVNWDLLPDKLKTLYLQTGCFIAENSIGNTYPRKVLHHLDTAAPEVKAIIEGSGAPAGRVGVGLTFTHPNVGRYPEFFPIWEPAGGKKGWVQAVHRLREMGVAYIRAYAHLSYNHPAAENYVPEASTEGTVPPSNPTAGLRACIDNSAWIRLWRDELIPTFKAHGVDGVYADEGHFPWGTCAATGPAHLHGPSAVGILTANTRGAVRLHKLIHEGLGPESIVMVEGAGDIAGRWADLNHAYPDPSVAYTLPFKRSVWYIGMTEEEPSITQSVNTALAHGYILGFHMFTFRFQEGKTGRDPQAVRRYVQTRKELDKAKAPGYPQGFRDTVGLHTTDPALVAKAFTDESGITVVYYATEPLSGEVIIEGAPLGHPSLGERRQPVILDKGELGFAIFRPDDGQ